MSITVAATRLPVIRSSSRLTNPTSKRALWATSTASPANADEAPRAPGARAAPRAAPRPRARSAGRPGAGAGTPGATSVSNVAVRLEAAQMRTAPISQMRAEATASPVVSRSKTTKRGLVQERVARESASATKLPRHAEPRRRASTSGSSSERASPSGARDTANRCRAASLAGRGRRTPRRARRAGRANRTRAARRHARRTYVRARRVTLTPLGWSRAGA